MRAEISDRESETRVGEVGRGLGCFGWRQKRRLSCCFGWVGEGEGEGGRGRLHCFKQVSSSVNENEILTGLNTAPVSKKHFSFHAFSMCGTNSMLKFCFRKNVINKKTQGGAGGVSPPQPCLICRFLGKGKQYQNACVLEVCKEEGEEE